MANDKEWQRHSDEWVKAMHESRRRKEKRLNINKSTEKAVNEKDQKNTDSNKA